MPNKASEKERAYRKAYHRAYSQQPERKARRKKAYGKPKYGRPKSSLHYRGER